MKILFIIIGLIISFFASAQTNNIKINKIRNIVAQINKDSGYAIVKLGAENWLKEVPDNGAAHGSIVQTI